jgi:hypothetical protein
MAYVNFTTITDWQYDAGLKKLKHNTGTTRITVNALYSEIMDEFDNAVQMDDTIPMKANTPTEYELINGWTFSADTDLGYLYGGSIKVNQTGDLWANFYTLGTIGASAVVYWNQNNVLVAQHPGYTTGHIDQLINVAPLGVATDSRYVTAYIHTWGDKFDCFRIAAPATGGRNPVPLATSTDINNATLLATVGAYAGLSITFGATTADFNQDGSNENYDVTINCGASFTVAQVYEWLKWSCRNGASGNLNGVQSQFYRYANSAYVENKEAPFGSFAGGKFFGARGVLLTNFMAGDTNSIILIDAGGVTRQAPTQISVAVTNVVSGDRVYVARATAGVPNKSQYTLNGIHSTGGTTVTVNEVVNVDIPTTGVIRIGDDRYTYSALNRGTKVFTLTGGNLTTTYASLSPCYCPIVDEAATGTSVSKALTYYADFDVVARVRKKTILPFENTTTVTNAGATIAAIRTADTIAV